MAALDANENFPRRVVESLRSLGHDVLTTQDAGQAISKLPTLTGQLIRVNRPWNPT